MAFSICTCLGSMTCATSASSASPPRRQRMTNTIATTTRPTTPTPQKASMRLRASGEGATDGTIWGRSTAADCTLMSGRAREGGAWELVGGGAELPTEARASCGTAGAPTVKAPPHCGQRTVTGKEWATCSNIRQVGQAHWTDDIEPPPSQPLRRCPAGNPSPQPPPRNGEGEQDKALFFSPSPVRGGGWGEGFSTEHVATLPGVPYLVWKPPRGRGLRLDLCSRRR